METTSAPANPEKETHSVPQPSRRFSLFQGFQTVISVAILMATLFTLWTPTGLFSNPLSQPVAGPFDPNSLQPLPAGYPTPTNRPAPLIGIVAGHWGHDSGAVCADGLTEVDVNLKIATLVRQALQNEGYRVDLLKEFDPLLMEYQAQVLVSIHNDSCDYYNDQATGYKVSAAKSSAYPEKAAKLTDCLTDRYADITNMTFHANSITIDMTEYHAFDEINANTTAAIIETGFLNLDREILTNQTDLVAQGVTAGILCYIRNESINPLPLPTPTAP